MEIIIFLEACKLFKNQIQQMPAVHIWGLNGGFCKLSLLSQSHNWWQTAENCLLDGPEKINPYFTVFLLYQIPTLWLNIVVLFGLYQVKLNVMDKLAEEGGAEKCSN